MNPEKMTQQGQPQQPELVCPVFSAAALMQGGPKAQFIKCIREQCGFWNTVGMQGPDGKVQKVGACGVSQVASFVAAAATALEGGGFAAGQQSPAPKKEEGVALHIPKKA